MLESLKETVCKANLDLVRNGLVTLTWGNASGIDRASGHVVIKPSGVSYDDMQPEDMVVVSQSGSIVEGHLRPSVDLPTHLALYAAWPSVGGIVHTHSHYATCWAQACRPIACFGTSHADLCYGDVPVTEALTEDEVNGNYELAIGQAIVRRYAELDPMHFPAVLSANHAPFAWGVTVEKAVENAIALEEVARMARHTLALYPGQPPVCQYLLDKHFLRKHGANAYYGQKS